jgi:nucleotide-binding universal stress UspA family protein
MAQKILAPLDGSLLAHSVLPHIVAFTRVNGTEVTLIRVLESNHANAAQIDPVDWHLRKVEAQAYLDELRNQLQAFNLEVQSEVLEGPAAERVIEYAQKHEYDLITLSSHGQSGLSGWPVGSVAQKIIQRSHKSVMLVPAYHNHALDSQESALNRIHYQRILVPLDGSQRAEYVLTKAAALARYHEADLLLVHVVTPPNLLQRLPFTEEDHELIQRVVERNRREAERYFDQLKSRLSPDPQFHILEGEHVATALHNLIEQAGVDLLIMSAHGHVREHKWPYGPLATHLMTYSAIPLLIFQDLPAHEIEPTQAERLLQATGDYSHQRLNPPELVSA